MTLSIVKYNILINFFINNQYIVLQKIKKRKIARMYAVLTHFSHNFALRTAIFADFGAIPLHKCINMPLRFNKLKIALCKKYCLLDYVSKSKNENFFRP